MKKIKAQRPKSVAPEKVELENFKQKILKMLEDPKAVKKAAVILEELLRQKS